MKKTFLFFTALFLSADIASADTPWWEQYTICRINPATCYANMGIGYDDTIWDITSNCWGKKYICVDALTATYKSEHGNPTQPVTMAKTEIKSSDNIDSNFDTMIFNEQQDCFGVRKTQNGGTKASVNGQFVKVWCDDVPLNQLDIPNEPLENGYLVATDSNKQPTCENLAKYGYVGEVSKENCYGRYYDESEYHIQCDGNTPILVILNGADGAPGDDGITTMSDAEDLFAEMLANARAQRQNSGSH